MQPKARLVEYSTLTANLRRLDLTKECTKMTDRNLALEEAELSRTEASLCEGIAIMMAAAAEFDRKVKAVRAVLSEASLAGHEDPSIAKRVNGLALPSLETDKVFERARRAREQAVEVRTKANDDVREMMAQWKQQLAKLNSQVSSDESAAHNLMAAARPSSPPAGSNGEATAVPPAMKRSNTAKTLLGTAPAVQEQPAAQPPFRAESKRASQRVRMQAEVNMTSDDNFFSGFSANISDGGVFIATINYVPKGTLVDLSFSLPSGEKISATGEVRWLREVNDKDPSSFPGLGVAFTNIDDSAQNAIRNFIAERDPLFYVD